MQLTLPLIKKLFQLKRGNTPFGLAPHKPVLIMTLIELIGQGHANQFAPDVDLVGLFQENFHLLVTTPHQADFTQPYYHLQTDRVAGQSLWQLQTFAGHTINGPIKSVHILSQVVRYGSFQPELFAYLLVPEQRAVLLQQLLDHYFPGTAAVYRQAKQNGTGYYHELEAWVLNEPEVRLKKISVHTEEEVYVRSGLFKRLVPQVYRHTCCISGMRLHSTFGHTYVDACHIVPFSISHDDRVTNGLSLCPNLHRAFDRGLIGLAADYTVLISDHIREDQAHQYSLAQLAGQKILLPDHRQAWPDPEQLRWHRENRFAG